VDLVSQVGNVLLLQVVNEGLVETLDLVVAALDVESELRYGVVKEAQLGIVLHLRLEKG